MWRLALPFQRSWWAYLFAPADTPRYCRWWERLWCRLRYHPAGQIFYNPGGLEPDDRCRNCGDHC